MPGQRNHRDARVELTDLPQDGQPVVTGEVVVEHDHVGRQRAQGGQRPHRVCLLADNRVEAGLRTKSTDALAIHLVVVDHQDVDGLLLSKVTGCPALLGRTAHGISTKVQYLFNVATTSTNFAKVTGFSR